MQTCSADPRARARSTQICKTVELRGTISEVRLFFFRPSKTVKLGEPVSKYKSADVEQQMLRPQKAERDQDAAGGH
jgi:hypothetical protein